MLSIALTSASGHLPRYYVFPYALNNAVSIVKLSACPHCNPGSNGAGSSSDRVRCALDEPADKGHNQQLGGHRRQPRQVFPSTYLPTILHFIWDFQCTQTTIVITDGLGVQGKKVQSDNGLEVLLNSNLLVMPSTTKFARQSFSMMLKLKFVVIVRRYGPVRSPATGRPWFYGTGWGTRQQSPHTGRALGFLPLPPSLFAIYGR